MNAAVVAHLVFSTYYMEKSRLNFSHSSRKHERSYSRPNFAERYLVKASQGTTGEEYIPISDALYRTFERMYRVRTKFPDTHKSHRT